MIVTGGEVWDGPVGQLQYREDTDARQETPESSERCSQWEPRLVTDPDVGPGGLVVLDDGESSGGPGPSVVRAGRGEVVGQTGPLVPLVPLVTDLLVVQPDPE